LVREKDCDPGQHRSRRRHSRFPEGTVAENQKGSESGDSRRSRSGQDRRRSGLVPHGAGRAGSALELHALDARPPSVQFDEGSSGGPRRVRS